MSLVIIKLNRNDGGTRVEMQGQPRSCLNSIGVVLILSRDRGWLCCTSDPTASFYIFVTFHLHSIFMPPSSTPTHTPKLYYKQMKKALFFTEQQVELPPSYNSHTQKQNNNPHPPFSPPLRDRADMQNKIKYKKGKESLGLC